MISLNVSETTEKIAPFERRFAPFERRFAPFHFSIGFMNSLEHVMR